MARVIIPPYMEFPRIAPVMIIEEVKKQIRKARHRLRERRRRESKPPEWNVWRGMKERCHRENHPKYKFYGAIGVKVCPRWREHRTGFDNFLEDMGPRPDDTYQLDRPDSDGDYCKENCRWIKAFDNRSMAAIDRWNK